MLCAEDVHMRDCCRLQVLCTLRSFATQLGTPRSAPTCGVAASCACTVLAVGSLAGCGTDGVGPGRLSTAYPWSYFRICRLAKLLSANTVSCNPSIARTV